MKNLGLIEITRDNSGELTHNIINIDADFFSVKNTSTIQNRRTVSRWTRSRSCKDLLNSDNHIVLRGGYKFQGTFISRDLLAIYLTWIIVDDISAECISKIMDDLGINKTIKAIHTRAEIEFGESVVNKLFNGYEIIKQFPVFGGRYFIDWYIPELNIAIEFDEKHHDLIQDMDTLRQKEIEKELGCKFLRYKDR